MTDTGQNFEIYQDEVKYIRVPIYDEDGNLLDLTSFDIVWRVYHPTTKTIAMTKTNSDDIAMETFNGVTNSMILITINPADTTSMLGRYNHECKIFDAGGLPSEVFTGTVLVINSEI